MRRALRMILSLLLLSVALHAQDADTGNSTRVRGQAFSSNSVYLGLLGPSIPLSLNYERIWTRNGVVNIGTKVGGFYSKFKKHNDITLATGSFEVNFLFGRSKHLFETGIGWAGYYGSYFSDQESKSKHYGIPTQTFGMAYRFQKPEGGMFFKVGFTGTTILFFVASDLEELAIGNAAILGFKLLTGGGPSYSVLNVGAGYSF